MRNLLTIALLFFICTGCDEPNSIPFPSGPNRKWLSNNIHDYTIDQVRACFCVDGGQKMRITVRSDTVYSVIRLSDNAIIPFPSSKLYFSINSLFEIIQNSEGDSLIVSYDPQYGYPDTVDINPQMHPYDGGVMYITSNLRVLK